MAESADARSVTDSEFVESELAQPPHADQSDMNAPDAVIMTSQLVNTNLPRGLEHTIRSNEGKQHTKTYNCVLPNSWQESGGSLHLGVMVRCPHTFGLVMHINLC